MIKLIVASGYGLLAAGTAAAVFDIESPNPALRFHLNPVAAGVSTNVVNPHTKAIRFFLGSMGFSTTNTVAELNALRASFGQWEAIPGTSLKFEEGGLLGSGVDLNPNDGTNVVFFARNTLVEGGLTSIAGTLGVTCITANAGIIEEADIVLNGAEWTWFTDHLSEPDLPNAFFVEGTATHEIGHLLGLLHSPLGGATMLAGARAGLKDHQTGVSTDEVVAIRHLYPDQGMLSQLGSIQGRVSKVGAGVFGAAVLLENNDGAVVAGTVTDANGDYQLPAMETGVYQVRATPLDPSGAAFALIQGRDIGAEFSGANTDFRPSSNQEITVTAGQIASFDIVVTGPGLGYHISHTVGPSDDGQPFGAPVALMRGAGPVTVGVVVPVAGAVVGGATLEISGGGITHGTTTIDNATFSHINASLIETSVTLAPDAVPGLRSFRLSQGPGEVIWANGFVEILPSVTDHNFDGLDDVFQRNHFPVWTAESAAPDADPDQDNFTNRSEFLAATDPNDAASRVEVQRVTQDMNGTTVAFQSVPGKRYQLSGRADFETSDWLNVGEPVTATGEVTMALDAGATGAIKFYRVELIP